MKSNGDVRLSSPHVVSEVVALRCIDKLVFPVAPALAEFKLKDGKRSTRGSELVQTQRSGASGWTKKTELRIMAASTEVSHSFFHDCDTNAKKVGSTEYYVQDQTEKVQSTTTVQVK